MMPCRMLSSLALVVLGSLRLPPCKVPTQDHHPGCKCRSWWGPLSSRLSVSQHTTSWGSWTIDLRMRVILSLLSIQGSLPRRLSRRPFTCAMLSCLTRRRGRSCSPWRPYHKRSDKLDVDYHLHDGVTGHDAPMGAFCAK